MGPSYRNNSSLQYKHHDDLESRLLSPRSSFGPTSPHSVNSRRRRSRALCSRVIAGLLVLCVAASFLWFHSHVDVIDAQPSDDLPIDVVGVSLKPSCVTRQAILSLNRHLKPRTIHVVTTSSEKCGIYSSFAPNVACHVQDEFLHGLTVERVGKYIEQRMGLNQHKQFKGRELSGWYMQQFLKLGSALALPGLTEHYLVWDLDMVLLSPVRLLWRGRDVDVDDAAGAAAAAAAAGSVQAQPSVQTLVNVGGSISPGYIASFRRLTKRALEFAPDGSSFVTHWMVVYKPYLLEFLRELSGRSGSVGSEPDAGPNVGPDPDPLGWVWRILSAVDPSSADLGFSEYASYISWVRQHYPLSQRLAPRKTWVRHPFGQRTVKLLRFLRRDRCCCPSAWLLRLVRALGFVYTGYEVGHIEECRYSEPQHETSYGL